jgi:guanosine-3',5'-bis(diphosphate) 3'-pyrophosphohydrolase
MYSPDRYVAALRFAAERHRDQLVPGTQLPYLVHVVSVASEVIAALAVEHDADLATCAALLHDTIEDTGASRGDIAQAFGASVADGVEALSKNKLKPKSEAMADSLARIKGQPREIWMVKLADRITNLAPPPPTWSREKCAAYRDEASSIADALGAASTQLDARLRARIASYGSYC